MSRRGLGIAILLFLFATALGGLIAFWAGLSQGAHAAAPYRSDRLAAAIVDTTEAIWECDAFGGAAGLRGTMVERPCGDGRRTRRRAQDTPLRRAMVDTISHDALAGRSRSASRAPDLFAPSPPAEVASFDVPSTVAEVSGDDLGSPTILGSSLDPRLLLGSGLTASAAPDPPTAGPEDPSNIVAPIPGALPLLATGFLALFGVARGRRRKPDGSLPAGFSALLQR